MGTAAPHRFVARHPWLLGLLAVALLGAGVTIWTAIGDDGEGPDADGPVVRVAVLPDQKESRLVSQYTPLLAYLDDVAGIRTELIIPASYEDLLTSFRAEEVDLAWFGGLTYLQADTAGTAEPLAMRDVDLEFTTDIVVAADAPGDSVEDFAGRPFAFGPELSTSGHLMPRFFLEERGLDLEAFFGSVVYSDGHDETARWVQDGTVQIGAINSVVVDAMLASSELSLDRVRVLETTTPYRNYVWVTADTLSGDVRERLLDAFLALELQDDEHQVILARLGAGGFVPAHKDDFADLRNAAAGLGLLGSGGS